MRVVLDLQGSQTESRYRGIGRYSISLAQAIVRQTAHHEIFVVLNSRLDESVEDLLQTFSALIRRENIRIFDVPEPLPENRKENWWCNRVAEKIREDFIQRIKPDVVLVTSLFEGYLDNAVTSVGAHCSGNNTAVILYDLIPYLNPAHYLPTQLHRDYYNRKIQSLRNAGLLLAISEASRTEAIGVLGIDADKVVNISAAISEEFSPNYGAENDTNELLKQLGISKKMVLYVPGGFDKRKNFKALIKAYGLLGPDVRAGHQLVIASKLDDYQRDQLNRERIAVGLDPDEMVLTGYVKDEALMSLYSRAALFVFPSKHEGFGLPVLEAMACGAPVIGSNTTSIPEVIGLPEALFDPESPISIAEKMNQALSDPVFQQRLRGHGAMQARKFSWDDCARRTIRALEDLARRSETETFDDGPEALLRSIAEIPHRDYEPSELDIAAIAECIAFNLPADRAKELLLDVSVIVHGDAKSGIQRVVRSLLLELLSNPPENASVRPIYFDETAGYRYANAFTFRISGQPAFVGEDDIVEFHQDDTYLALDLNAHLPAVQGLHAMLRRRGVRLYFVVYDLLLVQHPEWWPEGTGQVFEAWLRGICEVASGLFCISDSVAEEVHDWLEKNPPNRQSIPQIYSFHLGADVENSAPTRGIPDNASDVLEKLAARKTFLTVGTVEPRKGHTQVLAAFELLWQRGMEVNLIIVGKHGWLVDQLAKNIRSHPELNRRLFWLEGISDEYLEKIYASSDCLIAASEGEGFGLPLIEAAQHKKPIIARDIAVFREVAQNFAFYFSGKTPEELTVAIGEWLRLHERGLAPSSEYMPWLTWKQSAALLREKLFPER
jgi:glycosyltransferase involved in cell wall biosynthesis